MAHLQGVLDSAGVVRLYENLESQLVGRKRKVVLDFSEVDALDPMGLAELLKLSRWTKDDGLRLRVVHAAPHVEEAFRDNMISDVDFFANVEEATRFADAAPPVAPPPPSIPKPLDPRSPRPEPGFLKRFWLLGVVALVVVLLGAAGVLLMLSVFKDSEVLFLTESGEAWSAEVAETLTPGKETVLGFQVRNAEEIDDIFNEDWIHMSVEPGDSEDVQRVTFTFKPDKDFPPTDTYFYAIGKDENRWASPKIYLASAVRGEPPVFVLGDRQSEALSSGETGYWLNAGKEGEKYGPHGIGATGGDGLRFSATGHEPYGLKFDSVTGKFSGEAEAPTPEGVDYVPVKITARNDVGETGITALLFIEKMPPKAEIVEEIINIHAEEIEKRVSLVDPRALTLENLKLLIVYKDDIQKKGQGDMHRLDTVFFGSGKTRLPVDEQRKLDAGFENASFRSLAADPKTYFFVLGFADKGKTRDSVNGPLIKGRAETLRKILSRHLSSVHGLSATDLKERVRVIPMQPVPDADGGGTVLFESRERSRAGEIWLVKDPR